MHEKTEGKKGEGGKRRKVEGEKLTATPNDPRNRDDSSGAATILDEASAEAE